MDRYRVSVRRACAVVKQWRPGWYYQPKAKGDGPLLKRIEEIAAVRVRYGVWRIFVLLWWGGLPVFEMVLLYLLKLSDDVYIRPHRIRKRVMQQGAMRTP